MAPLRAIGNSGRGHPTLGSDELRDLAEFSMVMNCNCCVRTGWPPHAKQSSLLRATGMLFRLIYATRCAASCTPSPTSGPRPSPVTQSPRTAALVACDPVSHPVQPPGLGSAALVACDTDAVHSALCSIVMHTTSSLSAQSSKGTALGDWVLTQCVQHWAASVPRPVDETGSATGFGTVQHRDTRQVSRPSFTTQFTQYRANWVGIRTVTQS